MFLEVPDSICGMDLNDEQREDLAARIKTERVDQFGGNRKDAYTKAGVNSGTWSRAESGEPLAERSLVAIVRTLWPDTGGDWRRMSPPLGGSLLSNEVRAEIEKLSPSVRDYVRGVLEADALRSRQAEAGESA